MRGTWAALMVCAVLSLVPPASWAQAANRTPQRTVGAPAESPPRWNELSSAQRQALKPLSGVWASLSTPQKRKWIALSRNFGKMSPRAQSKLHARMGDWVTLSASERAQARLNFVAAEKLSSDDKQAKWQAYQALSDDERHRLAEQAPRRPSPGAAAAVRPAPTQRLTKVPTSADNASMPRIATAPHLIDPQTLLPQVDRYDATPARAPAR